MVYLVDARVTYLEHQWKLNVLLAVPTEQMDRGLLKAQR